MTHNKFPFYRLPLGRAPLVWTLLGQLNEPPLSPCTVIEIVDEVEHFKNQKATEILKSLASESPIVIVGKVSVESE